MPLIVAVPRERRPNERRVALVPQFVPKLVARGARVRVEAGCARAAGFHDDAWTTARAGPGAGSGAGSGAGAEVAPDFDATVAGAQVVLKVAPPTLDEVARLPRGSLLVSLMSPTRHLDVVEALLARGIGVLAMDLVPRLTRARSMNALASQATVAGYKAALLAAEFSPRLFPMLTTAAGTVRPANVVVIGAGAAGLQAIATVQRLGARVEAWDIRRAARERIESLGARAIETGVVAEGSDGLARTLRASESARQREVLAERLSRAHAVICAASIPHREAPRIIDAAMVDAMLPDTVIVDMASESGGNCELTRPGEQYWHGDVFIAGPLNLPSHGAVHASEMYARNVVNLLELVLRDGRVELDPGDEIVARTLLLHAGRVHHLPTAGLLGRPAAGFGEADLAPPTGTAALEDEGEDVAAGWAAAAEPSPPPPSPVPSVPSPPTGPSGPSGPVDATGTPANDGPPEPAHPPGTRTADAPSGRGTDDDFTVLDGVGPALSRRLRGFGYRRYAEIAELDDAGIERLAAQLELDDDRCAPEWRERCRRLVAAAPIEGGGTGAGGGARP